MSLGGKQQTQSQTQTQQTVPWAGQQPYLTDLFARAKQVTNNPQQYYPGQLVADRSNSTQEAQRMLLSTAQNAAPTIQSGLDASMFNLGAGRDIANNPYLHSAIQAAINPLLQNFSAAGGPLSQIRGHFQASNSGGNSTREGIAQGIAQRGLQQQVGDISSQMANQAYQQAQDQATRTLALLPQTLQATSYPASLVSQVGAQQDAYQQALIDAAVQRHMFNQQAPYQALDAYRQAVAGGNFGSSTTSTATAPGARTSPLSQGLGGAATGASLAFMIPGLQPFAGAAAGIGGLLGLLG